MVLTGRCGEKSRNTARWAEIRTPATIGARYRLALSELPCAPWKMLIPSMETPPGQSPLEVHPVELVP